MDDLRTLLVHLDGSAACAERLRVARRLAQVHEAELCGCYAVTPSILSLAGAFSADGSMGMDATLAAFDEEQRLKARAAFEQPAEAGLPRGRWAACTGVAEAEFQRAALCADLMVLGQSGPQGADDAGTPTTFVPDVLLGSGRPALVVPYIGAPDTLGQRMMIAWKPTREAARAVTAALPVLRRAKRVHLVSFDEGEPATPEAAPVPGWSIQGWLAAHGVQAVMNHEPHPGARAVGEVLLSRAADLEADLIVMGCYGHSRAREWALGGATRTLLGSMTVPVLMAH